MHNIEKTERIEFVVDFLSNIHSGIIYARNEKEMHKAQSLKIKWQMKLWNEYSQNDDLLNAAHLEVMEMIRRIKPQAINLLIDLREDYLNDGYIRGKGVSLCQTSF